MRKSSSGRDRAGSEMSSKSERRRDGEQDSSRRRSGADSMTSSSRRKSSRRGEDDDDGASFAPAITAEPSEILDRRGDTSRQDDIYEDTRRRSSKTHRSSKDERRHGEPRDMDRDDSRRDSRSQKSDRKEKGGTRALGDHDAALPANQFPGEMPSTYTQPYLPPGLASEYYGDHGQSVQFQPGVRTEQPRIVTNAEQAHLMEPTAQAKPPPEPSSVGKIGAAAGYFGNANYESDSGHQTTPSKAPQSSQAPNRRSKGSIGVSPRSSPGPESGRPLNAPGAIAFAAPAMGAAAEYYANTSGGASASAYQTPNRLPPGPQPGSTPFSAPAGLGGSQHHSNAALYGGAAALAGAAAGAYISQSHEHQSHGQYQTSTETGEYTGRYSQNHDTHMHQAHRHKHKGMFGKFVDWWRDPEAIAQYEQYTEAIGVCKYCFDPMSTPADAPRKHGYRRRRPSSGSRYGSNTRVDKMYRYSSDEERRKRSSTVKKMALGGLAGYGVGKVGETIYKQSQEFDDPLLAKSSQPGNQSRVSFQDEPRHERYGDVRLQKRESDRRSSRVEKSSHRERRHRRRSSSSSANSSNNGIPRGAAMSVGAAAAGLAIGAAALDRKPTQRSRSRSRSPTSKRKYYSKRVSPMHSYVDLSSTIDGPGGVMGFFTSPSANMNKGKKSKGLFNFANNSSSSSDADLRFGEGTVRRKTSTKRLRQRNGRRDEDKSTTAMMGLVAAGTALAAEADRRQDKGKQRRDADQNTGRTNRRADGRQFASGPRKPGARDDEWYDTDGDAESDSSVDQALAYGGSTSAVQGRDSSSQIRKAGRVSDNFREQDQRRYHDSLGSATHGSATSYPATAVGTAALAGAAGAIGGMMASAATRNDTKWTTGPLPPMRDVDPRPMSDPPSEAVSAQVTRIASTTVPLQQPQPMVPVGSFIDEMGSQSYDVERRSRREEPQMPRDRRRERRDSSPAKLPNQDPRNGVSFSLTDDQLDSERRNRDRESSRKDSVSDKDRRKSADAAVLIAAGSKDENDSKPEGASRPRRSSEASQKSPEVHDRFNEIERELEKLYSEHREAEERKRSKESGLKKVAAAAAVGVVATVAASAVAGIDNKTGSSEEITPRRKSNLKKNRERDSSPQSETQQERIARMAAQRVKSTPSPVQHDDYSSFFVPVELREHLKEHNDKSDHHDDVSPTVVEIVPGALRSREAHTFDPFLYRQFGLELEHDPLLQPWPVPMLGLIEPTPPGSRVASVRGDETPVIEPKKIEAEEEEIDQQLERKESKVTWGDHDTYVYEVQTPLYERSDYMRDPGSEPTESADLPAVDVTFDEPSPTVEEGQSRPKAGRTWTLDETEADQLEKELPVVDDRPSISRAWTVDDKEARQIEGDVSSRSPSGAMTIHKSIPDIIEVGPSLQKDQTAPPVAGPECPPKAQSLIRQTETVRPQVFYQTPFAETVSDLGMMDGDHTNSRSDLARLDLIHEERIDSTRKNEASEYDKTEIQGLESSPGPRTSKSEQRRRERANSSPDAEHPSVTERHHGETERDIAETPTIPGNDSVFDYLVNQKGDSSASPAVLGLGAAAAVLAADQVLKPAGQHSDFASSKAEEDPHLPSQPKRSSTLDDSGPRRSRSGSKADYQSDPEEWERSSDKKSRKSKSSSKSDVGGKTSSKSKSRRDDEEVSNVSRPKSAALDDYDEDRDSRRASRRGDRDPDEESITSRRSRDEEKKSQKRRSRDADGLRDDDSHSVTGNATDTKGKKKESSGFFGGLFSSNKSDVSTSSKKSSKSSKSESRADADRNDRSESRKKRKSRDRTDFDDLTSVASEPIRRTRRSSDPQKPAPDPGEVSRDQSLDNGFVSAEETTESPVKDVKDGESFLGNRPEMPQPTVMDIPMGTDGVSGPTSEREPSAQPDNLARIQFKSPFAEGDAQLEAPVSPMSLRFPESRQLSAIRTTDVPSSPLTASSPTAVPLNFRRLPLSPTNPRASMSSPGAAPSSPLTTPRTRQGRPKSTEFRNSKEFRPLYLVERRNFAKTATPDEAEDLPSLPSSRTSSAHPSTEDLRVEAQAQEQLEYFTPSRMSAEKFRERGRRHSHSYWHDSEKRRTSPDYLDSRSATPVPGEAQRARDQGTKPKPRYEFHSPSELLQDPTVLPSVDDADAPQSPLPSVASTDLDLDYVSARSRSLSPTRARSLSRSRRSASTTRSTSSSWHDALSTTATGVLAGSVLGIAAHEILKDSDDSVQQEATTLRISALSSTYDAQHAIEQQDIPALIPVSSSEAGREISQGRLSTEKQMTAEAPPDTSAWNNVFAEIHNRKRSLTTTSKRTRSESTTKNSIASTANVDVRTAISELAQERSAGPKEIVMAKEDDNPIQQEGNDLQRDTLGIEESIPESTSTAKIEKKKKKKGATLTFDDDLPAKKDENTPLDETVPASLPPKTDAIEPFQMGDSIEPSTEMKKVDASLVQVGDGIAPIDATSIAVEDQKDATRELLQSLDDSIDHPSSPLEDAFQAAISARGLTDGSTVDAAYQSFQPEIPDIGGTQLTTIEEEAEVPTPDPQQEPESTVVEETNDRKPSKKEKRKQKKSKQTSFDDWDEPVSTAVGSGDEIGARDTQTEAVKPTEESSSRNQTFVEPTPAEDRPNSFGNDFEIKPGEIDVPFVGTDRPAALRSPAENDDDWQATSKKSKKDKKKKKRDLPDWEEPLTIQDQQDEQLQASKSVIQEVSRDITASDETTTVQAATVYEDVFATPTETPQQETEDPWETSSKPSKKKPKSKKQSLPVRFEDFPSSMPEGSSAMTAPISDPDAVVDSDARSVDPIDTILHEHLIAEPDSSKALAAYPVRSTADDEEQVIAREEVPAEQTTTFASDHDSSKGHGGEAVAITGAAVAGALLASHLLHAEPEGNSAERSIAKARDTTAFEDAPRFPEPLTDVNPGNITANPAHEASEAIKENTRGDLPDPTISGQDRVKELTSAAGEDAAEVTPSQLDDDFLPITIKKYKKDKKKKRMLTIEDVAPEASVEKSLDSDAGQPSIVKAASTLAPLEDLPRVVAMEDASIPPTPSEEVSQQEDNLLSTTTKKSKKDKKKKRQSTLAEVETTHHFDSQSIDAPPEPVAEGAGVPEDLDTSSAVPAALAAEETPLENEEFYPASAKKSKKDKKKKKGSPFILDEPETEAASAQGLLENGQDLETAAAPEQASTMDVPTIVDTSEPQSQPESATVEEAVTGNDDWPSFTTKLKKDKKKRRTLIDDAGETVAAAALDKHVDMADSLPIADTEQVRDIAALATIPSQERGFSTSLLNDDKPQLVERQPFEDSHSKHDADTLLETGEAYLEPAYDDAAFSHQPTTNLTLEVIIATNNLAGRMTETEVESHVPSAPEPSPSGPIVAETQAHGSVAVETALVEPPSVEAPIVQSPAKHSATSHMNVIENFETNAIQPASAKTYIDSHRAVETPTLETSAQAMVLETPADEITSHKDLASHLTTVEYPPVETPDGDMMAVDTPANTDVREVADDAGLPVEEEWGFPVKKSKKDKKKNRTSALATDQVESESSTRNLVQDSFEVTKPLPEVVPEDATRNLALSTPNDDPATEDCTQNEWAPTSKSKKDKKKKRQSTLTSTLNDVADDSPKPDAEEPRAVETDAPTINLDAIAGEPKPVENETSKIPVEHNRSGGLDSGEGARTGQDDEWAFTTEKAKKDKKKKRQSMLADDLIAPEAMIDDAGMIATESREREPETLVNAQAAVDKPDLAMEEPSAIANTVSDANFQKDDATSQNLPEDEWAFTSAKSKKDKKKKRQSMIDPAPLEQAVASNADSPTDYMIDPPLMSEPEVRSTEEFSTTSEQPNLDNQDADAWAPAAKKKKGKTGSRKTRLDEVSAPADEGENRNVEIAESQSSKAKDTEDAVAEPARPAEYEMAASAAEQHLGFTAEPRDQTFDFEAPQDVPKSLEEPPSIARSLVGDQHLAQESSVAPVGDHFKAADVRGPAQHMEIEEMNTPGETSRSQEAMEESIAIPAAIDAIADDQAPDYFGLPKKKSKKDKNKRLAAVDEPESTDAFETPMEENTIAETVARPTEAVRTIEGFEPLSTATEAAQPIEEDQWSFPPTTKSKKSKKKPRQSLLEDQPGETVETPIESDDPFQTPNEVSEATLDIPSDAFEKPTSKKGKKQRQSTVKESLAEPLPTVPAFEDPSQNVDEAMPRDSLRELETQAATAAVEDWDVPVKSKGKKKRQSTLDDTATNANPPTENPDSTILREEQVPEQGVLEGEREIRREPESLENVRSPAQPEEDSWDVPKSSKKDKKKKRMSTFADFTGGPTSTDETLPPVTKDDDRRSREPNESDDVEANPPGSKIAVDLGHESFPSAFAQPAFDASSEAQTLPHGPSSAVHHPVGAAAHDEEVSEGIRRTLPADQHDLPPHHLTSTDDFAPTAQEPRASSIESPEYVLLQESAPARDKVGLPAFVDQVDTTTLGGPTRETERELAMDETEAPPQDELWAPPAKKSKKKKRQSTFDETAFDSPQVSDVPPISITEPATENETSSQPLTIDTPIEDAWTIPSKKSKSKRTKDALQFLSDDAAVGFSQAESSQGMMGVDTAEPQRISETGVRDLPNEASLDLSTTETVAEETWIAPGKKSKDKKKRNTMSFEDESQPTNPAEERPADVAIVNEHGRAVDYAARTWENDNTMEEHNFQMERSADTTVPVHDERDLETEPSHTTTRPEASLNDSPAATENSWAVPAKKSKKNKKKNKQILALGDFDVNDSQTTAPAEPELVEETSRGQDVGMTGTSLKEARIEDLAMQDVPESIAPEPLDAPTMLRNTDERPLQPMRKVEGDAKHLPIVEPAIDDFKYHTSSPHDRFEPDVSMEPITFAPALQGRGEATSILDEPAPAEADWAPGKTTKKDKRKSKRQFIFDDTLGPQEPVATLTESVRAKELPATTEANVSGRSEVEAMEVLTSEPQPTEDWEFSTKKSKKKSKKGKGLIVDDEVATPGTETPRSTDQFESATQTPLERTASPEPVEDVRAVPAPDPIVEDYFTSATSQKKSKKDKKRKSLLAWDAEDQLTRNNSEPVTPAPVPNEDVDMAPVSTDPDKRHGPLHPDELYHSSSVSKNLFHTTDRTDTTAEDHPRGLDVDANIKAHMREAQEDSFESTRALSHEVIPTERYGHMQGIDTERRDDLQLHGNTSNATSQAGFNPASMLPIVAAADTESARDLDIEAIGTDFTSQGDIEPTQRKKSKKDKKAKKDRRVSELDSSKDTEMAPVEPAEEESRELDVMETIPEETAEPSLVTAAVQERNVPEEENLSDVSESTRERRRRRRSPPVWSGEEPNDLPKNRSLTPPPEPDDIMDTALGVAAELGFGGRDHETTRAPQPKPTSPSRQPSAGWSFARLNPVVGAAADPNRDSAVQFESPVLANDHFTSTRDSGFIPSPATGHADFSPSRHDSLEMKLRPPRPQSPTSSTEDVSKPRERRAGHGEPVIMETPRRKPSPVDSTTKDRSSVLFNSSPAVPSPLITTGISRSPEPTKSPLHRSPSIHGHHHSREELRQSKARAISPHDHGEQFDPTLTRQPNDVPGNRSVTSPESRPFNLGKPSLSAIREDSIDTSHQGHSGAEPSRHQKHLQDGVATAGLAAAAGMAAGAVASRDLGAKSLGRSKSRTSSLRNLRGNTASPFDPDSFASSSSQEAINARDTGKSAVRDRDMADVYDGYGSYPGSPKSPTRPQSVRRRQSMQQIKDLEARLDQLASENRALVEAKIVAEQHLEQAHFEQNRSENSTTGFNTQLQERDAEISRLKQEVASLIATHESLRSEHEENLSNIQQEHDERQSGWQESSRDLETLRSRHNELSTGMESIVRREIDSALVEKNAEIQRLRDDLTEARAKLRELQSQILAQPMDTVVISHDEDYFDQSCQKLCQQVQGWVLRFSKFSDLKLCRSTNEVRDEKIVDRFDNAILDGSDVDAYLSDRVKRRDVFMSVVMTMIWEYVFTRYLFGMDREQRQKLKLLEKNLGEVGEASAVHQWRALTLTLLSKRETFKAQRESDTEAVAIEIFSTLSRFLPPPQNLEDQIVGSLRNVMRTAVDLSIEMRTQRAEYMMLPPLSPEYDTNGDLARKVYFNASLMNERSGETTSNEELEREQAVVRMVLFPLVVKKGDDDGVGDDEIVVCPAQVLIAKLDKAKKPKSSTRNASGGSDAKSLRAISTHSLAMSGMEGNDNMF